MKKYFPFLLLTIGVIISGCVSEEVNLDKSLETAADTFKNMTEPVSESSIDESSELEQLKVQLLSITSREMTPEAYTIINNKIKYFESLGYETREVRNLLSQFKIGGQQPQIDQNMYVENTSSVQNNSSELVVWKFRDGKWIPTGTPSLCDEPLTFQAPVNLDIVNAILYPGQIRGDDFKPHGGFITYDIGPVEVRAPRDGYIWRVSRFYDEFGIHYMYDIQDPCGIMYRLGHLGKIPEKFENIFDETGERDYKDSRTTEVSKPIFVKQGEVLALDTQKGSGFDFGVYDLRKENEASKNPSFREAYTVTDGEQAFNAVCWLNYLPENQQAIVKNLPAADGKSGSESDYC